MSVFSYHIVRVSFISAIKILLFPPDPSKIPGLIHAEYMSAMALGAGIFSPSRILIRQLVVFAQWENEELLDHFLLKHPVGITLQKGWHTRLLFLRQWGSIRAFNVSKEPVLLIDQNAPVVAVTIARMKLPEVPRFIRWGRPVEKLVRDHPATTLSLASISLPRTISTFSVWQSLREMTDMVHGHSAVPHPDRHANAMKERNRKDFHFEFTTLRFKAISESGKWQGRSNIIPGITNNS